MIMSNSEPTPVDEIDMSAMPAHSEWIPRWVWAFDDYDAGACVDDHCIVPLIKDANDYWQPAMWLPRELVLKLGEAAESL